MARPAGDSSEDDDYDFDYYSFSTPVEKAAPELTEEEKKQEKLLQLYNSIVSGYLDDVKKLIKEGLDVNCMLQDDFTPILVASSVGDAEITKFLLDEGASANSEKDMHTALMAACSCTKYTSPYERSLETAKLLVENGAELEKVDRKRMTAFLFAASSGNTLLIEYLMPMVNIFVEDNQGWSALFWAVTNNHVEVVKLLLTTELSVDKLDIFCNTLQSYAVNYDFPEIVELLPKQKTIETIFSVQEQLYDLDKIFTTIKQKGKDNFMRDIYCLLVGMNCEHLKILEDKNLSLYEFLTLTDERLLELGVKMPYQRYTILRGLYRFHKQSFKNKSMPMVKQYDLYGTDDIAIALLTALRHFIVMEASLEYVIQNADLTKLRDEHITSQINILKSKVNMLKRLSDLLKSQAKQWDKEIKPVDLITKDFKRREDYKIVKRIGFLTIGISVALYVKKRLL